MKRSLSAVALLALSACAPPAPPQTVGEARQVDSSPSAAEAKALAPQALLVAEGLLREAESLADAGKTDEAEVVAEQALAAFEEAFALSRAARAEQRLKVAEERISELKARLAAGTAAQTSAARDAETFEMRAQVALDQEPIVDIETLTPERALVRRRAARQLLGEAQILCLAASLLDQTASDLAQLTTEMDELEKDLGVGSIKKDLYPRAANFRNRCLTILTLTRRTERFKRPDAAGSERLQHELAETGRVLSFKDDRGVVINLRDLRSGDGELNPKAKELMVLLARASQSHAEYPVLVLGHRSVVKKGDQAPSDADLVMQALRDGGAKDVTVKDVGAAQPVVDPRVPGAASQNDRVEVIFVTRGR